MFDREVKLGELILSELNWSCTMDFIPDVKPETIVQEAPTVYIHPKFKPVVPKVKPRQKKVTRGTNHLPIHQRLEQEEQSYQIPWDNRGY